ncbi:Translin-associated protein X [Arachis hypogaea]|nr:Translin-associated protein X [Arachis hypogaea]
MLHSFTASFFRVSLFMASNSKPQRLYQSSNVQASAVKKARTMATESAIKARFTKYVEYLNDINEKRERVVKASRDVTMNSKKVIFQVHRMSKYNKEEVLQKAEKDLAAVTDQYMSLLVKELQGTDFWKLRRAYLPGVLNILLQLADLIGELMHLTIGRISDSELEFAQMICIFARHIYRVLTFVVPHMDDSHDMKTKLEIMLQSVMKIENGNVSNTESFIL